MKRVVNAIVILVVASLAACSKSGSEGEGASSVQQFTIGGTVTGLNGSVVLRNNGGDDLTLSANDPFTFSNPVNDLTGYAVSVFTQPAGQTCTVSNASDTMAGAAISNVAVSCVTNTYTIGGTVTGLNGTVVLRNNGGDDLTLSANDPFTFSNPVNDLTGYAVSVFTQPAGQTCTVSNASDTMAGAAISNVAVSCVTNTYTIGGTVTGLNGTVVLKNNGGDDLTRSANGSFTFSTALNDLTGYEVSVLSQPAGQTCTVNNASNTLVGVAISNVYVICTINIYYNIGGTVSGLNGTVVLQNNGSDDLTLSTNGPFTFSTALNDLSGYEVSVRTQALYHYCDVSNGAGALNGQPVTDVEVTCRPSIKLNDTGVTLCGDAAYRSSGIHNLVDCASALATTTVAGTEPANGNDPVPAGQDALYGRDVTHNDDSDGHAGFSFTKIGSFGAALADQTKAYNATGSEVDSDKWDCVQDNVTSLMWGVKHDRNGTIDDEGLHDADDLYTWYNTDSSNNGGFEGYADRDGGYVNHNGAICSGYNSADAASYCNTQAYVARVNAAGWCGHRDWRLPSKQELIGLVNFNYPANHHSDYFPYPPSLFRTWSSTVLSSNYVKLVDIYGRYNSARKSETKGVRLVRDSN